MTAASAGRRVSVGWRGMAAAALYLEHYLDSECDYGVLGGGGSTAAIAFASEAHRGATSGVSCCVIITRRDGALPRAGG